MDFMYSILVCVRRFQWRYACISGFLKEMCVYIRKL
jgi:hypothetical protein